MAARPRRREPVLSAFAMTDVRLVERKHWGEGFTPPPSYSGDSTGKYELKDTLRRLYLEYGGSVGHDRRVRR